MHLRNGEMGGERPGRDGGGTAAAAHGAIARVGGGSGGVGRPALVVVAAVMGGGGAVVVMMVVVLVGWPVVGGVARDVMELPGDGVVEDLEVGRARHWRVGRRRGRVDGSRPRPVLVPVLVRAAGGGIRISPQAGPAGMVVGGPLLVRP